MKYQHLTDEERYRIAELRMRKFSLRAIARILGRSPSTVSREIQRNAYPTDGKYRAFHAIHYARARRSKARRGSTFEHDEWLIVRRFLKKKFSPKQIAGTLRRFRILSISHETIYQPVWEDRRCGGDL